MLAYLELHPGEHGLAQLEESVKDASRGARALARRSPSMSLFVGYFGTNRTFPEAAHHTIVLGPRYKGLLDDIFTRKVLADEAQRDAREKLNVRISQGDKVMALGHRDAVDVDGFVWLGVLQNLVKHSAAIVMVDRPVLIVGTAQFCS